MTKFAITPSEEKISGNMMPYLTIPLIKVCTQKCVYCGDGAEMTLSDTRNFDTADILDWHADARELGIEKFRITGGEPFIHKEYLKIVQSIAQDANFVLVNTNGTLLERYPEKWRGMPMNVRYVVNCHGVTEQTYDAVSGTTGYFEVARRGIETLADEGLLHRLNAVYNKKNAHEIWDIIGYARVLGVDVKIQDVVSVPWAFNDWSDVYLDSRALEMELEKRSSRIRDHVYAKSFGTPSKVYTIDGVNVTLKSVRNGAQYDLGGVCKDCPFFPCHEGIYDIFAFADNSLWACNWTDAASITEGGRKEKLQYMIDVFQRASYSSVTKNLEGMLQLAEPPRADQRLEFVSALSST